MMDDLPAHLQSLCAGLLDAALALVVGAALLSGVIPAAKLRRVMRCGVAALGLALVGNWWSGAAAMTGAVGVALPAAFTQVLMASHFGAMIEVAGVAWVLLAGVTFLPGFQQRGVMRHRLLLLGLLLFAFARAATGHAMDKGIFSFAVLVQTTHVMAAAAWAGATAVTACLALGWHGWDAAERTALAQRLSQIATLALVVVVCSGLLNVVRLVGDTTEWQDSAYVWLLGAKLAGVALAASLGAYNRWRQLPNLHADDGRHFARVLVVEALVLGYVLGAAAQLGAMMPPQ